MIVKQVEKKKKKKSHYRSGLLITPRELYMTMHGGKLFDFKGSWYKFFPAESEIDKNFRAKLTRDHRSH